MANDRIPMTPRGLRALREELKYLREVERPKNVRDIEEARAHGDLRENAEFSAAKERQAFIEGRSRELDGTIALSTGHYKSGISLAPLSARGVSALLNGEKPPASLDPFDPHRSATDGTGALAARAFGLGLCLNPLP